MLVLQLVLVCGPPILQPECGLSARGSGVVSCECDMLHCENLAFPPDLCPPRAPPSRPLFFTLPKRHQQFGPKVDPHSRNCKTIKTSGNP